MTVFATDFDDGVAPEFELQIELASTGSDTLLVDNDLTLTAAATLSVSAIGGFVPDVGDEILVACAWGTRTGTFPDLPEGATVATIGDVDLNISYTGGDDGIDVILIAESSGDGLLGDVNMDGLINLLDVAPFVTLLSSGDFQAEADINQDGVVNLLDVQPFVDLLSN